MIAHGQKDELFRVGVVGLGAMGAAFAARLAETDVALTVWNRDARKAAPLAAAGATVAGAAADACRGDVVLCVLFDDDAVESFALDERTLDALAPDAVLVLTSTISHALAQRLEATYTARGRRYVGAPMFGGPEQAKAGNVTFVAGGDADAIARVVRVLSVLGRVERIGERPSTAHLTKLAGNFLAFAAIEALGEASAILEAATGQVTTQLDVLCRALFPSYAPIVAGTAPATKTRLALPLKDLDLMQRAAADHRRALPLGDLILCKLRGADAAGLGDADVGTVLARMANADAGTAPRG